MENATEYGTLAKEVALHLGVSPNTLRRWSLELEKQHYLFERNAKGQRIYYERDIQALSECKMILNNGGSMENAATAVAVKFIEQKNAQKTLSVIIDERENDENLTLSMRDLESMIETAVQKAVEQEREVMLQALELKMNDAIEQRDRMLMQALKETQEAKKLMQQEKAEQTEKKKGFFSRLFS